MRILLCDIPLPSEGKFGPLKRLGSSFPPLNLLVHGAHCIEHLGQVGLGRPANRLDRLSFDEPPRQRDELPQRRAEALLDPRRHDQCQQSRQQGAGEEPVHRT